MKIYYREGDLLSFDNGLVGIVCENDCILYFNDKLVFDRIDNCVHGEVRYKRLTNTVRIQPVVFVLRNVATDISIKNFLECEFNMQLDHYIGNALIYYIFNHLNMTSTDKSIIVSEDFFTQFQLKNNLFMKDIYLNV
tara:strand:+ start:73 stop:483 length:411 start_codon:yes stop_codon:yes gene_type:complete